MPRAARQATGARAGGTGTAAPPRLVVLRGFTVWHHGQLVAVPPGIVSDAALVATLHGIRDPDLLEWRHE